MSPRAERTGSRTKSSTHARRGGTGRGGAAAAAARTGAGPRVGHAFVVAPVTARRNGHRGRCRAAVAPPAVRARASAVRGRWWRIQWRIAKRKARAQLILDFLRYHQVFAGCEAAGRAWIGLRRSAHACARFRARGTRCGCTRRRDARACMRVAMRPRGQANRSFVMLARNLAYRARVIQAFFKR